MKQGFLVLLALLLWPLSALSPAQAGFESQSFADVPATTVAPPNLSPEIYQGSFFDSTAGAMLNALGVKVYPEDVIQAFPDPALGIGSRIFAYRSQPVLLDDGGTQQLMRTMSQTVADFLKEKSISVGSEDIVQPSQQSVVTRSDQPFSLSITRVSESDISRSVAIPFSTQRVDDGSLSVEVEKVTQAGQDGQKTETFHIREKNGQEVSRTLVGETVNQSPTTEIIHVGTKVEDYGSGQASWYFGTGAYTAAHRTLPFGTKVRVTNTSNGKSVVVKVNDRGPFIAGRVIDLDPISFAQIGSLGKGVVSVRLEQAP